MTIEQLINELNKIKLMTGRSDQNVIVRIDNSDHYASGNYEVRDKISIVDCTKCNQIQIYV